MQATKTEPKQTIDNGYRPICPVHKVDMEMITYSWGEIDFICPVGHVV